MTEKERIAAEAEILQLTTKRDGAIQLENEMWAGILEQIALNNPAVLEHMNKFNGTLLEENDKKNAKLLDSQLHAYEGLNTITSDGTYKVKSTIDGSWNEITVKTDSATGEIIGLYDHLTGQQYGYTVDMADNIGILGQNHEVLAGQISTALANGEKAYVSASGVISTESGLIIGQMQDIKEATDGTKEGFVNINGTPSYLSNIDSYRQIQGIENNKLNNTLEKLNKNLENLKYLKNDDEGFKGNITMNNTFDYSKNEDFNEFTNKVMDTLCDKVQIFGNGFERKKVGGKEYVVPYNIADKNSKVRIKERRY